MCKCRHLRWGSLGWGRAINTNKQTELSTLNQDRITGIIFTTLLDTTEKLEKTYEMIFKTLAAGKKK